MFRGEVNIWEMHYHLFPGQISKAKEINVFYCQPVDHCRVIVMRSFPDLVNCNNGQPPIPLPMSVYLV